MIFVVTLDSNKLVERVKTFEDSKDAEKDFVEQLPLVFTNFDGYTTQDIDNLLDDGIAETVGGRSVQIFHD